MRLRALAVVVLAAVLPACGGGGTEDKSAPTTDAAEALRKVDIGGRSLALSCTGSGSTTAVVEMGFDADVSTWGTVQKSLAGSGVRTCVYQRAGWGESDAGPAPRDANATVADLVALAKAAPLPTPLVVISSSAGSLTTELLMKKHPELVMAAVFVDPRTSEYQLGYRANLTREELAAQTERVKAAAETERGPELAAGDDAAQQVAAAGAIPKTIPFVVLTAGEPATVSAKDAEFWRRTHERLAASSPVGKQRVVAGAPHAIWVEQPEVVADAVRQVVAAARGGAGK